MRPYQLFSSLFFAALLTACNSSSSPILQVTGHYEGELTNHLDEATYSQVSVATDVGPNANSTTTILVKDVDGKAQLALVVSQVTDNSITLQTSLGNSQTLGNPVILAVKKDLPCYTATGDVLVTLCTTAPEISYEIQNPKNNQDLLSLVLHHFSTTDTLPQKEEPQSFTLTQAIDVARTKSFTSRIEFEHVIQAKLRAKAAYLHLLPQITMGTIANGISAATSGVIGAFASLLASIGDLAPFLLPSRWIQADQAVQQSKAEQDTNLLMRLDMGVQVEGMFYAYARDSKTRDLTQATLTKELNLRHEVKVLEDLGKLPLGSTANLDSIINQVQQSLSTLNQVTTEDLASVSQTLGFYSPTAVSAVSVDTELVSVEKAPPLDFATVKTAALNRSFELDQMDDLIAAAHDSKTASYFSWLDPVGDPSLGLGFALPTEIEILSSQIQELLIDRQQLQSVLEGKAFDAVTDYGQALQSYQIAVAGMAIQETRLKDATTQFDLGIKEDYFGLVGVWQDYLMTQISLESAIANYRVARAEIDRLLLQGYYAKF